MFSMHREVCRLLVAYLVMILMQKQKYAAGVKDEYENLRENYLKRRSEKKYISIDDAKEE